MADKIWTATDLKLGSLSISHQDDGTFHIERRYHFLDGQAILEDIKIGRLVIDIHISQVPTNILTALQEIDVWTKQKALEQEGMA